MLYFSYGSNMSVKRLQQRVPAATRICVAILSKHKLVFHKKSQDGSAKCDIQETGDIQHRVIGVLYEIPSEDKWKLDEKEGLGNGYETKDVILEVPNDKLVSAFAYYATLIDQELRPFHWYKEHVLCGARENSLPASYIQQIEAVESVPDPQLERCEKELSIYREK